MKLENISYLFVISSVLALEDRLSAVVAELLRRNAKGASPLLARAAKKDAILNQEELPPYLSIESLGESFILDKPFSKDDGSGVERRQLMLFANEYEGACATPAILYYNTNHTGVCGCDDSLQDFNRIVCMVDEADCSLGLCIEERDVWTFHVRLLLLLTVFDTKTGNQIDGRLTHLHSFLYRKIRDNWYRAPRV